MKRSHAVTSVALGLALVAGSAITFAGLRAPAPTPKPAPAAGAPAPDEKTQYDLARAVAAAKSAPAGRESARLAKTRREYAGRRFQWEAAYLPALCRRSDRCFVAPFDHARRDAPAQQGWLVELELEPFAHAKLERTCSPHARGVCVIRFEGRLDKLVLRSDLPTAVGFRDVAIDSARAARSGEAWIRRAR